MAKYERERKAALNAANKARKLVGLPPVDHLYPGRVGWSASCPITNTVYDDDLDRDRYGVETLDSISIRDTDNWGEGFYVKLSDLASRFVTLFDDEKIPDLIKPSDN